MDARLRQLLRKAMSSGDALDVQEYISNLRRLPHIDSSYVPFLLRPGMEEAFQSCAERYYSQNIDLFWSFLQHHYNDLASLFGLPGRYVLLVLLDSWSSASFEHEPLIPLETSFRNHLIEQGVHFEDPPNNEIALFLLPSHSACERRLRELNEHLTTLLESESDPMAVALIQEEMELWKNSPLSHLLPGIRGTEISAAPTISEVEDIFNAVYCLGPVIRDGHLLNWRGQHLGDLEVDIIHHFRMLHPGKKKAVVTKLGVVLPLWLTHEHFAGDPLQSIITPSDLLDPGAEIFIFEIKVGNEMCFSLYTKQEGREAEERDPESSPFILDDNQDVTAGSLPETTSIVTLLDTWGGLGQDIRDAALNALNAPAEAVLWLPTGLPFRPLPSKAPAPVCPACLRLQPYHRLCRKHSPG